MVRALQPTRLAGYLKIAINGSMAYLMVGAIKLGLSGSAHSRAIYC